MKRETPEILFTHPVFPAIFREVFGKSARLRLAKNRAELEARLATADALVTLLSDRVDEKLLSKAPRLRALGNYAVGVNNIDLTACARRGVRVVNTPDVLTRATAELALTLLLAAARRVPEGEALCRANRFKGWAPELLLGIELKGRRAVLVGKGRIGKETAKLFRGIGLKVEWITRRDSERSLRRKLSRAQVLSLHLPLTPETRHWLDAERLACLPRECIVINTTRGPTIDEPALIRALAKREIFAAGLDVFEREPEIPAALRRLSNTVLLPHVGSATRQAREAMALLVATGVRDLLNGKRPRNEVKFRSQ